RTDLLANVGAGVRPTPLRRRFRPRVRWRALWPPVDLRAHASPPGGQRLLPLQGDADIPPGRRVHGRGYPRCWMTSGSHSPIAAATASTSAFRAWSPGTVTTMRCSAEGGIP